MATRLPTASLAAIAVGAFVALVLLPRPAIPLIDGDVWWHIRAGEEVLQQGTVPRIDTWTLVSEGKRWVSQDWLSNIMLALGYRIPEWGGTFLSILFALVVAISVLVLWAGVGMRHPRTGWLTGVVAMAAGVTVAGPVIGVRVQVIDLALAACTVFVLWKYLADRRLRYLIALPLIAVAWANLHAGWLMLFLLGGAAVVGEAIDQGASRRLDPTPLAWRDIGRLCASLALAAAAISINPNGIGLYAYPLETSAIAAHRDFLAEWSPPDLATLPGQLFAGFVVLGVLPTVVLGWKRLRAADLLILIGLTVMAASAARFLLFLGPIGAAIIAIGLGPVVARSRLGLVFGPTLDRMQVKPSASPLRLLNLALLGLVVALGVSVTLLRVSPSAQHDSIGDHMPVSAVDWIVATDPGSRPFNTYSWGGYLGYRRPDAPVFIDGRSDIHGDAPIRAYADAISLRSDPQELLDAYAIDHVLFNTDHGFAEWLDASEGWRRVYQDPMASVWVREEDVGG